MAAGRFVPQPVSYPANDSVKTFNHIVPRIGATYDLTGDGKTVLKANWGRFYFNPGIALADAVNVNTANQYADHVWNDLNGDRIFQEGEAGHADRSASAAPPARRSIPNLRNSYGDETSFFVERAVVADLGVRAGFVYKTDRDGWQQVNASRPYSNFNIPVTVVDPGPDGVYGNGDDANVAAFNLSDTTTRGEQHHPQHRRLRERLQDHRVRGQQALLEPLVDERVVLAHLDAPVRQHLLQQPLRHAGGQLLAVRQLSLEPEREDGERVHRLERQGRRARSTPAGACA